MRLLTENDRAFESVERAIGEARRSIWAEFYLIRNDETGRLFLDLLARRAREGLEVRLLYDAFGSFWLDAGLLRGIRRAGGRAEAFLPLNPLRRRWAIHLRNHRKMVIADGEAGFTGGMNMGDEYSGRARRRGGQRHFRDTHLELRGPAVADLAQIFAEDWYFATGEELRPSPPPAPPPGAGSVVAKLPSGPDQDQNASGLVYFSAIASARRRCYVTSPYFIPDAGTSRALVSAALRGVDARVLVPGRSDVALVGPAARSFYPQLVPAGVRVFEYQPRMLHAKTMAVDGAFSVVGSANVDMRSFRLNFEVGALILDSGFARDLEGRFLADLS
ncbi:MAG: cardiolipin synthase, partial [Thermoanaerobaculia bacterium]